MKPLIHILAFLTITVQYTFLGWSVMLLFNLKTDVGLYSGLTMIFVTLLFSVDLLHEIRKIIKQDATP